MKYLYNTAELIAFVFLFSAKKFGIDISPWSCTIVIIFHLCIYIFDQAEKINSINNGKEAMKSLQELKNMLNRKDIYNPLIFKPKNEEEGYN